MLIVAFFGQVASAVAITIALALVDDAQQVVELLNEQIGWEVGLRMIHPMPIDDFVVYGVLKDLLLWPLRSSDCASI